MPKIALISDTHSYLDSKIFKYFEPCDEIWHAGDIGNTEISDHLKTIKPLRAVYGNIDGTELRKEFKKDLIFEIDQLKVYITHIGGYPGRYNQEALLTIKKEKPGLFICGHSHILKVMYDKQNSLLHMNPGAAGIHGFHKVKTLLRFDVLKGKIDNLEVIELGLRAEL